jgi:hypothetical protein
MILAIILLVSSISTYLAVSRELIVDQLRGDLASRVARIDEQIRSSSVQTRVQLSAILQRTFDIGSGQIAWVVVQNADGEALSRIGFLPHPMFSIREIGSHLENRQPIFKTADTAAGKVLIEVFPLFLPPSLVTYQGSQPRRFSTIEIAEFWGKSNASLWALKRRLLINASAAFVLLAALTTIALCFRSYLAGRTLAQEIEIARSVQRDLLPTATCELVGFDVSGEYSPVSRVGGDFYDTFAVHGERAAFVLGDVSGHGIPAALVMGVLHGAVRSGSWTESRLDHQEATRQMNQLLCERAASSRFATMFWSYFDCASQHLRYINAGQCPPLLVKPSQRNTLLRLCSGGPLLGLLADADFQQGSVRLDYGDVLILYSDGINEATNAADENFGEDRIAAIVRMHSDATAEEIRNLILAAVDAFTGATAAEDDRTLVVIVYTGVPQLAVASRARRAIRPNRVDRMSLSEQATTCLRTAV